MSVVQLFALYAAATVLVGFLAAVLTYRALAAFFEKYGPRFNPTASFNRRLAIIAIVVGYTLVLGGGLVYGWYLVSHG